MNKVAAIIPAYNEEVTIADVVKVLVDSPVVQEVIVVSDGSTDNTSKLAHEAGATVYEHAENSGKGEAMLFGVSKTDADVIAFFDADLIGFTLEHVEQLAKPVLVDGWHMACSLRDRGLIRTWITRHLPLISGERVLRREVIEKLPPRLLKGFMVEAAMNYHCRSRHWTYGAVPLQGLSILRKHQKVGYFSAVIEYLRMFFQVGKAMLFVRIAHLRGKL
jgi:glycosyltransferase involved in cell wall biosynthesis